MQLNASRWVVLLAAVLGVALMVRLGWWQLDRAAQKTQLQTALDERHALPLLVQRDLATDAGAAVTQHHRRIALAGHWVAEATVYLENRQMQGRPGFFVVTPLRLDDGTAVLVQRGWQPRDLLDRTRVVPPPTPASLVQVSGRIAPPPARLYEFDGQAQGPIRQNLDVQAFGQEWGLRLRPLSLMQLNGQLAGQLDTQLDVQPDGKLKGLLKPPSPNATASPAPDGLLRDWLAPASGVHKHYGYAFQWFALAALILGLYVWFQLIRPRRSH